MLAHCGTELVVAANYLKNARWQNLLGQLSKLEGSVGCEWRRLDNHAVTSHEAGCDLAKAEDKGKVPWADGATDTQRRVLCVDRLLVVFDLLRGNVKADMVLQELASPDDLDGCELPLLARQYSMAGKMLG